jgi:2-dehydro-3-deoxyphosphogluconate aldolase / (4S)-4-hydroxy-2-oxoglutarate aldolase
VSDRRRQLPPVAAATGVIAVLRATHADQYPPVIDALIAGGVRSIELTLSTAGVLDALPGLIGRYEGSAEFGVGTVTDAGQCVAAIQAGAAYIVTPVSDHAVIDAASAGDVAVVPGGLTPTELFGSWSRGAAAVKAFPASLLGPGYIRQLRGPFPDMKVIPSGGIEIDDVGGWIAAGASAVSLGGPLIGDAFAGGALEALTERARWTLDQTRKALGHA